jgi:hypothetical protein
MTTYQNAVRTSWKSPSWEDNSCSASQEITCLLLSLKVQYRIQKDIRKCYAVVVITADLGTHEVERERIRHRLSVCVRRRGKRLGELREFPLCGVAFLHTVTGRDGLRSALSSDVQFDHCYPSSRFHFQSHPRAPLNQFADRNETRYEGQTSWRHSYTICTFFARSVARSCLFRLNVIWYYASTLKVVPI